MLTTADRRKLLRVFVYILLFTGMYKGGFSQIGLGITTPHPNAYFQVNSTSKGVLLPRMSAAQRIAIAPAASANGLLVFDTDSSSYFFWTGSLWQKMGASGTNYWTKTGNDLYNNNTGLVGIGTNNPQARLHVADSPVVFTGPDWINEAAYLSAPVQAAGIKMLWYPQRAAFRVGQTSGDQLARDSVGPFSFASGYDNKSVNYYAFSAGVENRAGGLASAAIGQLNRATGNGAMALGVLNDAQGQATFAAGQLNVAFGSNSVAMGNNNQITGTNAVALGGYNEVAGAFGFAVGSTNIIQGNYSSAIGLQNLNNGGRSLVYGYSNNNYGEYSIVNGYGNTNNANYSMVSGMSNRTETSNAEFSFVMGMSSRSEQRYGWAFGSSVIAKSDYSIAQGTFSTAQGEGAIAMGNHASTLHQYGVAIGQNSSSIGEYGFAYGYNTTADSRSIAMGYEDTANYSSIAIGQRVVGDWQGVAMGFNAFARGSNNIAIGRGQTSQLSHDCTLLGWGNQISGNSSTAIGSNLTVTGNNAGAWGNQNTVSGADAYSIGNGNSVDGTYSLAAGLQSHILANNSSSWGNYNTISGDNSVALGNSNLLEYCYDCLTVGTHLNVSGYNSTAIGRYNDNSMANINNPIFQIGNGDIFTRQNALTILSNGNMGIGILDPQEKLHVAGNISSLNLTGINTRILSADPNGTLRAVAAGAEGQVLMTTGGTPQWSSFNGWLTNGNWSTDPATNFIGTIDAADLVLRTANAERMRINSSGNVGIGINVPSQKLDVQGGNARINNSFIGDVGHSSVWAGFAHSSQANTTGYALLSSNDGNFTFINKKNTGVGYIGFRVSNTDVAVISNAGKMGIGTNNPSNQLEVIGGPSAQPVFTTIANRGGFGPAGLEFVSDYGFGSQWRPGYIRSNDIGGFTGAVEIYTNGSGAGSLYNSVKGLEVRNGVTYTASGTVSSWSDARLKKNIQPFSAGLEVIQKINPVRFQYCENAPFNTQETQIGVIAQELELVAPYMVSKHHIANNADLRSVNNQAYVFLLINAVKEQQQQLNQQQQQLADQQQINEQLQQQINDLRKMIQKKHKEQQQ